MQDASGMYPSGMQSNNAFQPQQMMQMQTPMGTESIGGSYNIGGQSTIGRPRRCRCRETKPTAKAPPPDVGSYDPMQLLQQPQQQQMMIQPGYGVAGNGSQVSLSRVERVNVHAR